MAEHGPADQEGRWAAAVDGKTCRQGLGADGSPVQMLNVVLQRVKLTLDQWSIGGDKTNEPGSLEVHLAELFEAYPTLQLLTGDAIYAQRPLLELLQAHDCDYLFQVKTNPFGQPPNESNGGFAPPSPASDSTRPTDFAFLLHRGTKM